MDEESENWSKDNVERVKQRVPLVYV